LSRLKTVKQRVSVFEIAFGDKANAWNHFIHRFRPPASVYFFVDAYAVVQPFAFDQLSKAIASSNGVNAATALPTTGRSAASLSRRIRETHGLHGSLHALRRDFVDRICARKIRLPIGLYWGDGLIGAMAMFDLEPCRDVWTPSRIAVAEGATWKHRPLSLIRVSDLMRQLNRMVRQARGRMENVALKPIIREAGFEGLPAFSDSMLQAWIAQDPANRMPSPYKDLFGYIAVRRVQEWSVPAKSVLEAYPVPL
jgi:hypothetical protein